MSKVSITQAAKMAGVSRQTFYTKYINTGVISVDVFEDKKSIDVSEIIRVFGSIQSLDVKPIRNMTVHNTCSDKDKLIEILEKQLVESTERENRLRKETQEREARLNEQIDELRKQQNNLLEDKTNKIRKKFLGIF